MPRTIAAAVLLAVLALLSPGKAVAGPPEGVSGKMVFVPPVNYAEFVRIKEGMSLEKVEFIIGGPAGNYRTWKVRTKNVVLLESSTFHPITLWEGNQGTIFAFFNDGRLERAGFLEAIPDNQ